MFLLTEALKGLPISQVYGVVPVSPPSGVQVLPIPGLQVMTDCSESESNCIRSESESNCICS